MSQKKTKSKNRKYTVLIVPQTADQTRSIHLTTKSISLVVGFILFLAGASFAITCLFYSSQGEIHQVNALKDNNKQQKDTIARLGEEIDQLEQQQSEIQKKQEEIKQLMGLSQDTANANPSRGGQGGEDLPVNIQMTGEGKTSVNQLPRVQKMKIELDQQEQELDELLKQVSRDVAFYRGLPNSWPVKGEITSYFGYRSSPFGGRGTSFHNGLDIAGVVGTNIGAAGDGTVVLSGWYGAYGKAIMIDHGNGYTTLYGHNSQLLVEVGDEVKKGEPIARMGNTGRSTGTHCHFSIFKNDIPLDPLIYLAK